jgi:exosortase
MMASDRPGVAATLGTSESARRSHTAAHSAAVLGVAVVLVWAYSSNLRELVWAWAQDPDYSHGFLVIPVALLIYWERRPGPDIAGAPSPRWGWVILGAALASRAYFFAGDYHWLEAATLLPAVAGLTLTYGGWPLLRRAWPAVAFLVFMLPLPPRVNSLLAQPLRQLATQCSCRLLRLTGLWVFAEGNVIVVGADRLEVADACNGLSMLMGLTATVAAAIVLIPMPVWKRVVLFASAVPIALFSNVVRISLTAWCVHWFGSDIGGKFAHDLAGWLMMPLALLFVGVELLCLSWLVEEEEEADGRPCMAESPRPLGIP